MVGSVALLACTLIAQSAWSVSIGPERFSLRDVSRSGPPVDASPIEWRGSGPSLVVVYTREGLRRFHRVNIDLARAASFEYAGPVRRATAPSSDHALRLEGRYEYRRYFLNDLGARGLDVGLGVQGVGRRLSVRRIALFGHRDQADTAVAAAGSVAARWHRSDRWSAEVTWVNGAVLVREHESGVADSAFTSDRWGAGWLTDLAIAGTLRLTKPWSLTASYLHTGEGVAAQHTTYSFARGRIVAGVTYAR